MGHSLHEIRVARISCHIQPPVSLTGPGTCTINADQAGDFQTLAAPQAQQSFAVAAAPVAAPTSIPTLGEWGVITLSSLLAPGGALRVRRRDGLIKQNSR